MVRCPKCNQNCPTGASFCLSCASLLPKDLPQSASSLPNDLPQKASSGLSRSESDPWRSNGFPPEVGVVLALMTLEVVLLVISGGVPSQARRIDFLEWMMGGLLWILFVCLDLLMILGLLARARWAWWLTITLWTLRTAAALNFLLIISMDDRSLDEVRRIALIAFVFNGAPVVLLWVASARGAYLPRMAGERAHESVSDKPTPTRKTCRVCGDPCPPVDNHWTREGLCSKKCKDRESA